MLYPQNNNINVCHFMNFILPNRLMCTKSDLIKKKVSKRCIEIVNSIGAPNHVYDNL